MSAQAACAGASRNAAPSTRGRGSPGRPSASRRARALAAAFAFASLCALAPAACGGGGADAGGSSSEPAPTPTQRHDEPASNLAIGGADCAALARAVGGAAQPRSEPTPPLSHCELTGRGLDVNVYLDVGHAARQRYKNRMVEQVQFGAPDRSKLPHPVANVGDPGAYDQFASWVPAYATLFAVRGNRWLTVAYSRPGVPKPRLRAEAAALARLAFRLVER